MDLLLLAVRLELVGDGAVVAEQAVSGLFEADNAGQDFAGVDAHADLDLAARRREVLGRGLHHEQAHPGHLQRVELGRAVHAAGHHVRVADRLDLVDIEQAAVVVEFGVQPLEHGDHVDRLRRRAYGREAHDVTVQ